MWAFKIRLACNGLTVTNALAYSGTELITSVKSFFYMQAPLASSSSALVVEQQRKKSF